MSNRISVFTAADVGPWRILSIRAVTGETLPEARSLNVSASSAGIPSPVSWSLSGITSNERYVTRAEKARLVQRQEDLGRPEATRAVLIPIRKSESWWALTQDERRAILEEQSRHIAIGLDYLPAVARKLYHCRDISGQEPFDFLTWFEFAPKDESQFDDLLDALRRSEEWTYVEREVEVRLERNVPD
jgi:chlorite dismutase